MTDTLFEATLATARRLGIVRGYKASGTGSTTTLVDTVGRKEVDDYWNEGTIWITEDAGGASAAPEGEFSIITDFANSTSTITFGALTAATAASDKYVVASPLVPLQTMIEMINQVLYSVYIPAWDTTSLDTASAQTEYSLPEAVTRGNLIGVWMQTQDDANDNQPMEIKKWWVKEGGTGSQDTLVIDQYTPDWDLWIYYKTRHPEVRDAGDSINEIVDLDNLSIHAAVECLQSLLARDAKGEYIPHLLNRLEVMKQTAYLTKYPIKKRPKFRPLGIPRNEKYSGEVGKVRL